MLPSTEGWPAPLLRQVIEASAIIETHDREIKRLSQDTKHDRTSSIRFETNSRTFQMQNCKSWLEDAVALIGYRSNEIKYINIESMRLSESHTRAIDLCVEHLVRINEWDLWETPLKRAIADALQTYVGNHYPAYIHAISSKLEQGVTWASDARMELRGWYHAQPEHVRKEIMIRLPSEYALPWSPPGSEAGDEDVPYEQAQAVRDWVMQQSTSAGLEDDDTYPHGGSGMVNDSTEA